MKINGTLSIKQPITLAEKIDVINTMVSYVIDREKNGSLRYTPYCRYCGLVAGIARFCLEGVLWEEGDDLYSLSQQEPRLRSLIQEFMENRQEEMEFIQTNASAVIEYRKQELLYRNPLMDRKLGEILEKEAELHQALIRAARQQEELLSQQARQNAYNEEVMKLMTPQEMAEANKKLLSADMTPDQLTSQVAQQYLDKLMARGCRYGAE